MTTWSLGEWSLNEPGDDRPRKALSGKDEIDLPHPPAGTRALSGKQQSALIDALVHAYPSYDDLAFMLKPLDKALAQIVSDRKRLPLVVQDLVTYAESDGWTTALITQAALDKPGNPSLRVLIASGFLDYGVAVDAAWRDPNGAVQELLPQSAVLRDGVRAQLERIFRSTAGFQDPIPFIWRLLATTSRVCHIKITSAAGCWAGTGFLVGPDLVLTNHHVVADVIDGRAQPTGVQCVFDYQIGDGGTVQHGTAVALARDWLVASSPSSPVDLQLTPSRDPTPDELDYALIRLAEPAGDMRLPDGRVRGWLDVLGSTTELTRKLPLLIMQHPTSQPIKLAVDPDGVLGINDNGTRLTYRVNTDGGSSGSPCFTMNLDLVALHHAGNAVRNEGIPITAIAEHLRRSGHAALLGGRVAEHPVAEADRAEPAGRLGADQGSRTFKVIGLVSPEHLGLLDAVRRDRRVDWVEGCSTADLKRAQLASADALVISTNATVPRGADRDDLIGLMGALPVVLLASREAPDGLPLVARLAESVTQIVVTDEPLSAARRVVDHLAGLATGHG